MRGNILLVIYLFSFFLLFVGKLYDERKTEQFNAGRGLFLLEVK